MQFQGQVWFDFSERPVWEFYRFVREVVAQGDTMALDWLPLPRPGQESIASAYLSLAKPEDRGRFLHAALGLVHLEGADPADAATVSAAAAASRLDVDPAVDTAALHRLRDDAAGLGVMAVPTVYRHGPVVNVVLNAASTLGDVGARARTIWAMVDDDGIWELRKP